MTEQSKTPRTDAAEIIESLKKKINKSAKLQSLLYDIGLLPEQLQDDDLMRWADVEAIVLHFEVTETENADLRRQVDMERHVSAALGRQVADKDADRIFFRDKCEQAEAKLAAYREKYGELE